MRYLLVSLLLSLSLTGCFGTRSPKVYIVNEASVPMQIITPMEVDVRCVDMNTNEVITTKKVVTGYFALSPALYQKLVKTSLLAVQQEEKKDASTTTK